MTEIFIQISGPNIKKEDIQKLIANDPSLRLVTDEELNSTLIPTLNFVTYGDSRFLVYHLKNHKNIHTKNM